MEFQTDDCPRKQTEVDGPGNGSPPRPTAVGLGGQGRGHDARGIPDIASLKKHKGSLGSLVIGPDGLLLASDFDNNFDPESLGVWALGVVMNSAHVIKQLGSTTLHEMVLKTFRGYLIVARCEDNVLVTISDGKDLDSLLPLLRGVTQLLARRD